MKLILKFAILCLCLALPSVAQAGAWPQAPGDTQVIISYEPGHADRAFDLSGDKTIKLNTWDQTNLSLFVDHGVSERFTLTAKVNLQDYKAEVSDFSGLGSVEVAGRWTAHKGRDVVLAFGGSIEGLGQGRRSDFDASTQQGTDVDLRAYAGKSFQWLGKDAFVDLQGARHLRQYEADQWRVDATIGIKPSPQWMVMAQVFAGQTDKASWGQAKWINAEVSVVRHFGPKLDRSVQLSVRQTVAGRNVPVVKAVMVSLWKTF
ncbi:hypothetical protein MMA231_02138 [Asticcacaulis sp. MM231]|uniref:hypothetical protein n=1 Tax=Asticcacaulis sp. MM231 TaxID=3157666 RepID=UPI0032D58C13